MHRTFSIGVDGDAMPDEVSVGACAPLLETSLSEPGIPEDAEDAETPRGALAALSVDGADDHARSIGSSDSDTHSPFCTMRLSASGLPLAGGPLGLFGSAASSGPALIGGIEKPKTPRVGEYAGHTTRV